MKSYLYPPLAFLSLFLSTLAFGQETDCNNGLDDDGNGFIDCYDGACTGEGSCDDFYFGNTIVCQEEPTDNPSFTMRLQWGSPDKSANSHSTPAVGDIDQDGTPEIIVTNKQAKTLNIIDGVFGGYDANIANENGVAGPIALGFEPENAVAIADFEGDGYAEIIVVQDKGKKIAMYRYNDVTGQLEQDWIKTAADEMGLPGIADFNQDGIAEIYYRDEIRDVNGNIVVAAEAGRNWIQDVAHGPVAVDIDPSNPGLELVSGGQVWSVVDGAGNLTLTKTLLYDINVDIPAQDAAETRRYHIKYYSNWNDQWTMNSVADFDQDGNMDVFMPGGYGTSSTSFTTIFWWTPVTGQVRTYQDPNNNHPRGTGRVNIADVNGDGDLNAIYISDQKLYALKQDMTPLWIKGVKEGSSGFTSTTLFDFDGDGASETIYRSESEVMIIDGTDASTRVSIPCVSRTQEEYPIVADVDNDGQSELCVTCYTSNSTPFSPYANTEYSHVRVYEADGGEVWQPSRTIWNQHAYFNVNINDNLTVPKALQDHTILFGTTDCNTGLAEDQYPLNGFLNQSTYLEADGCPNYVSPDLALDPNSIAIDDLPVCPDVEFAVSFDITNEGDTDIAGSLPVTFYRGDPLTANGVKLNTFVNLISIPIEIGETRRVTSTVLGTGGDFELFIVINDNGSNTPPIDLNSSSIAECEADNNIGSALVTYTPFPLSIEMIRPNNEKCEEAFPDNGEARAFFFGTIAGKTQTMWYEDFQDLAAGTTVDTGDDAWSFTGGLGNATAQVDTYNGAKGFFTRRIGGKNENGMITFTTQAIDVTGSTDVRMSVDLISRNGGLETSGDWRDFTRAYYNIDGGAFQLMANGDAKGSYTYQSATASVPDGTTTVQFQFEIHSTSDDEQQLLDNLLVTGQSSDVTKEFSEADGFQFNWFAAGNFTDPVYTGSRYSSMAEGDYDVVGFASTSNCFSDTVRVTIGRTAPTFNILVTEVNPLTNCTVPDGELSAAIEQLDSNGDPIDTVTVGYDFTWFLASEGVTPIGTGSVLSNRSAESYLVFVQSQTSGCTNTNTEVVTTNIVRPAAPDVTKTDVVSCTDLATGEASASVGGSTAGYLFRWYNGSTIKPTHDFEGAVYSNLSPGDYTVVTIDDVSKCSSPTTTTVTINPPNGFPTPATALVSNNTSCDTPNGEATVDADGAGTVTGYTFEWFIGANTSNGNLLPNATYPSANISADGSTATGLTGTELGQVYTIRVTNDATNCSTTTTVSIIEEGVTPTFNFVEQVDAGNALYIDNKAYVEMPQAIAGLQGVTISYWAYLDANNYVNDNRIFSSGGTSETQVVLWTDNTDGIAFVVKTQSDGGRGRINTYYKPTGWVQITGTWSDASGVIRVYANGVKIGQTPYAGTGDGLYDAGNVMYLGRDGNFGNPSKFVGRVDEFRLYNRELSQAEIGELLCDPNAGTQDGLIINYSFEDAVTAANIRNSVVTNTAPTGATNNASIIWQGGASQGGTSSYAPSEIACPISSQATANTSCDPNSPVGRIDLTDGVDPISGDFTYTVYKGYEVKNDSLYGSNTTGIFENLPDNFYT
ncbi:MAG: hypothetical protein ACI9I8_001739, partial [Cellvibrionaceae bacterium]